MTYTFKRRGWFSRVPSLAVALAIAQVLTISATQSAQGQTLTVLYSFAGQDGAGPTGELIRDRQGNLYGTTSSTVFKLDVHGRLHTVQLPGGPIVPMGNSLIRDSAGNLYGTTLHGGNHPQSCKGVFDFGCGMVFKVDTMGLRTVLYAFNGNSDGQWPAAGLLRDAAGNMAPPSKAATPTAWLAVAQFSRSIRQGRRPSCIASLGLRTGPTPQQNWFGTHKETSTALRLREGSATELFSSWITPVRKQCCTPSGGDRRELSKLASPRPTRQSLRHHSGRRKL